MPRKRKSLESVDSRRIDTPVDSFLYVGDSIGLFKDSRSGLLQITVKGSPSVEDVESVREWRKTHNLPIKNIESIHKRYSTRKTSESEGPVDMIVKVWHMENGTKIFSGRYVSGYEKIALDTIRLLCMPPESQKELYRIYRESRITKLEHALDALNQMMGLTKSGQFKLVQELEYLLTRRELYMGELAILKNKRAGPRKLLYIITRPMVEDLRVEGWSRYQIGPILDDLFIRFRLPDVNVDRILNIIE